MVRSRGEGLVRVLTLDRPDSRNALRPADLSALRTAVAEATEPVVYLHGAGDAFCAGADLDVVSTLDDPAAFARQGQRVASTLADADAVVVCGIDGAARGGGVELALAADVRVATPDATFAEPGVRFGLFGAWGGTVRLPRVMGEGDALEFALSGRVLDADDALRTGLVSRVAADPRAVADEIAEGESDALRVIKERIRDRRDDATREAAEATAFETLVERHAASIRSDRAGDEEPHERDS
ncbi:enoyl-CoA hydratase/carnithine racemase [Halorubrum alkaliphilum]|uniref:Enoyl-CoA hydratase/carnithine racemase n=1 Tax=Halorubrum alkaliphilum TaxID=261290 RepID=A0A8T4GIN7_9EURY|nr:enoyl-CoA hydratase/isomerase family protein [Halorubrum alkaliphilum]MBP1922952.1 enoyl-CoA hydratase/carnithine racemase [Halorubrum alkaliphilum]